MEPSDVLDQSGATGELSVAAGVTSTVLVKVTFTVSIGDLWTSDEKQSWILIGAISADQTINANLDVFE